ncbi:lipid-A-disaccharide synthase [Silvibacterium acidisoli]|uniref:lipid-A-disaccharide synthase n=1 Tax=Acidobacteriaceae bacterium ZG23-2 TaxID=2883246 RepID=UPI00406BF45E
MTARPKIFLSAGEASGEAYGASLISLLRDSLPQSEFFGLGGQHMEALGMRRIVKAEDVAVMGITEVIRHLPHIYREYRRLKASIQTEKPDLAVLIDFPDVNLSLAKHLHRARVPVVYFVSPQLWAWKKYRIREVQRYVDRMVVIFPFEEQFYRERQVEANYVGHPLADLPLPTISREDFARKWQLDPAKRWVGLLPGSRAKEIRLNLPGMIEAAQILTKDYDLEFVLPLAHTLTAAHREMTRAMLPSSPRITITDDARGTLLHARASAVASGTATVEAALIGQPYVVVYKVSPLSYAVAKRVVDVPHVAMVNLIAGRPPEQRIIPELIQGDFTAANLVSHLRQLLDETPERAAMVSGLREVSGMLKAEDIAGGDSAMQRLTGILLDVLQHQQITAR